MDVDYFTKWAEVRPTYSSDAKTVTLFLFNHVITRFRIPRSILNDHGMHFWNTMMDELITMLHLDHERSSPYYPQANDQVESIIQILKTMLQRMVGKHKSNWHIQLFSVLWEYRTSTKTTIGFTHFQLVYGLEVVILIE
jgi:transposase InsO family protein